MQARWEEQKLKQKKRNEPTTEKAQEKKSRQADSLRMKSRVAFAPGRISDEMTNTK